MELNPKVWPELTEGLFASCPSSGRTIPLEDRKALYLLRVYNRAKEDYLKENQFLHTIVAKELKSLKINTAWPMVRGSRFWKMLIGATKVCDEIGIRAEVYIHALTLVLDRFPKPWDLSHVSSRERCLKYVRRLQVRYDSRDKWIQEVKSTVDKNCDAIEQGFYILNLFQRSHPKVPRQEALVKVWPMLTPEFLATDPDVISRLLKHWVKLQGRKAWTPVVELYRKMQEDKSYFALMMEARGRVEGRL